MSGTGQWPERLLVDVGAELRAGRTAEPNESGETYDDCVGINYAPFDVQSCGFHISAVPRRIGVREVAAYANRSCKRCHGLGYWNVQRRMQTGTDESGCKVMQDVAYEQSCDCADKRYKAAHKLFLIDSQLGEWIQLDDLRITTAELASAEPVSGTLTAQDVQHAYDEAVANHMRRAFQPNG